MNMEITKERMERMADRLANNVDVKRTLNLLQKISPPAEWYEEFNIQKLANRYSKCPDLSSSVRSLQQHIRDLQNDRNVQKNCNSGQKRPRTEELNTPRPQKKKNVKKARQTVIAEDEESSNNKKNATAVFDPRAIAFIPKRVPREEVRLRARHYRDVEYY